MGPRLGLIITAGFLLVFLTPLNHASAQAEGDTDYDGLTDTEEITYYHTDPRNSDSDGDSIRDGDEVRIYHSNLLAVDTDGDGFNDGEEVQNGFSPLNGDLKKMSDVDTDRDGLNDSLELQLHTDLMNTDTDADGVADGAEVFTGYDPLSADPDRALQRTTVTRHVEVDLNTQQMDFFINDVKLGTIPVSTGKRWTPTPRGEFTIFRKLPVHRYVGENYDIPGVKWNLEFKRGYYLHGAFWHKQFGIQPMSHGCVNIAYKDVEKLYIFLDIGDKVVINGDTPWGRVVKKPAITQSLTKR
jgi:lipoprotein-anchoring transpeptidase ErfK/SrfK